MIPAPALNPKSFSETLPTPLGVETCWLIRPTPTDAYGLTPPPACPPTGMPAMTFVISVRTLVLSIVVPPLPKKFGAHEKSSSRPNTPALIQPTAAPTFSLLLLLTAPRSVLPALPPKSTPTDGLTKPSARAGVVDSSNPNVHTTAIA